MWTDDGENILEPPARAAAACKPAPATRSPRPRISSERADDGENVSSGWPASRTSLVGGRRLHPGMTAVHDGVIYQVKWRTQGNDPVHNCGGVGQPSTAVDPSHVDVLEPAAQRAPEPLEKIARWSLLAAALGA